MASFNSTVITTKGQSLMAKIVAGTATPQFTKIRTSDHSYPVGTDFAALTVLTSIKQETLVASVTKIDTATIKVSGAFTNVGLGAGYYVRNIGLYAIDPTDGEILYSITSAVTPDWMPPAGGVAASSIMVDIQTVVSNSNNVSLTVDPNATATVQMVNDVSASLADVKAFVGYNDTDIYGVEVDFVNRTFKRLAGAVNKSPGADFNGIKAFGGRKRCNLSDAGVVNAYYGGAGYIENGSNGQVMVEQPKFYYKVVPLTIEPIADYAEVNTFTVTAGCGTSGNVTITLNGVAFNVAVLAGDAINAVATKIRNATYAGWTTSGTDATVIFTSTTTGVKTTGTFGAATTGVTATVAKTIAGGISKGYHMRKARYYVSDFPKAGFKIHPAFVRNGAEKSKIYLPAYEGILYDVSAATYILNDSQIADFAATTGDKLSSIANAKPTSGLTQDLTRAKTRILATNRGAGWQQKDVLCASASQMLMMIEYAAMNMQTAIGKGVCDKAWTGANDSVLTGSTTNLGNASGMATGTNGLVSITYRGEENFWGNIWKWIDGLNIEIGGGVHEAWYADNGFVDDIKTSPYKNAGFTLAKQSGYVSAIGWSETCDFLFLTTATLGDTALPVGDYFWQDHFNTGWRVAILGGRWNDGLAAGAFYWGVGNSSADRFAGIGGGGVYVPAA